MAQESGQDWKPPAGAFAGGGAGSPEGRWREVVPGESEALPSADLTPEQRAQLEQLNSIGYLGASRPASGASGVTVYDRTRVADGLNFYTSGHAAAAVLTDMDGRVLHTWRRDFLDVWPDRPDLVSNTQTSDWLRE